MPNQLNKQKISVRSFKLVIVYAIISLIWIYTSDIFLESLNLSASFMTRIAVFKGTIFVFVTSLVLYLIIRKNLTTDNNYKFLFRNNPQPMWIYDLQTLKFLEVNDAAIVKYGYTRNEFLKMTLKDIRPGEDINLLLEDVKNTTEDINSAGTWRHKKKNGDLIFVDIISHAVTFRNKAARLVLAYDISIRKLAEEKLARNEARYRKLFENNLVGVFLSTIGGKIIDCNSAFVQMYGYSSKEEILGTPAVNFHNNDGDRAKFIDKLLEEGSLVNFESLTAKKDGSNIWTLENVVLLTGKIIQGTIIDISERKKAEIAIRENEEIFSQLMKNSPIYIFFKDENIRSIRLSKNYEQMLNMPLEDILGKNMYELFPSDLARSMVEDDKRILDKGELIKVDEELNGRYYTTIKFPIKIEGKPRYLAGFTIDITEQKNADMEILRLNRVYALLSNTNQAIVRIKERQVLFDEICRIAIEDGKFRMAWIGYLNDKDNKIDVVASAGKIENYLEDMEIDLDNEIRKSGPVGIVTKNGEYYVANDIENDINMLPWREKALQLGYKSSAYFPLIVSGKVTGIFAIYAEQQKFFKLQEIDLLTEMATDISFALEYIKAEEERKKALERIVILSRSVEQSPASIIITDQNANIEFVNTRFTEQTGYTPEEVIGRNPGILSSNETPGEKYEQLWEYLLSGKNWHGEFLNKKKNGELFWQDANISPIINEDKKITHFVAVQEDITSKKKMLEELVRAKEKAEEMNRLKSNFLTNMSHELRTPMIGIMGYAEILKEKKVMPEISEMTNAIYNSSRRLMRTLNQILDLSTIETDRQQINFTKVNLADIALESLNLYKAAAKNENLSLNVTLRDEAAFANIDESLILQIVDNLVNNAIKFTKTGGVDIEVETELIGDKKFATIKVIDTGIGIMKEIQDIIFEEFRQASEGMSRSYQGTGLGLSITKKFIEIMGGKIFVYSEPGRGSTFTVKFPAVAADEKTEIKF